MKIRFATAIAIQDDVRGCVVIKDRNNITIGEIHDPKCKFSWDTGYWCVHEYMPSHGAWELIARCHTLEEAKQEAIAYWF